MDIDRLKEQKQKIREQNIKKLAEQVVQKKKRKKFWTINRLVVMRSVKILIEFSKLCCNFYLLQYFSQDNLKNEKDYQDKQNENNGFYILLEIEFPLISVLYTYELAKLIYVNKRKLGQLGLLFIISASIMEILLLNNVNTDYFCDLISVHLNSNNYNNIHNLHFYNINNNNSNNNIDQHIKEMDYRQFQQNGIQFQEMYKNYDSDQDQMYFGQYKNHSQSFITQFDQKSIQITENSTNDDDKSIEQTLQLLNNSSVLFEGNVYVQNSKNQKILEVDQNDNSNKNSEQNKDIDQINYQKQIQTEANFNKNRNGKINRRRGKIVNSNRGNKLSQMNIENQEKIVLQNNNIINENNKMKSNQKIVNNETIKKSSLDFKTNFIYGICLFQIYFGIKYFYKLFKYGQQFQVDITPLQEFFQDEIEIQEQYEMEKDKKVVEPNSFYNKQNQNQQQSYLNKNQCSKEKYGENKDINKQKNKKKNKNKQNLIQEKQSQNQQDTNDLEDKKLYNQKKINQIYFGNKEPDQYQEELIYYYKCEKEKLKVRLKQENQKLKLKKQNKQNKQNEKNQLLVKQQQQKQKQQSYSQVEDNQSQQKNKKNIYQTEKEKIQDQFEDVTVYNKNNTLNEFSNMSDSQTTKNTNQISLCRINENISKNSISIINKDNDNDKTNNNKNNNNNYLQANKNNENQYFQFSFSGSDCNRETNNTQDESNDEASDGWSQTFNNSNNNNQNNVIQNKNQYNKNKLKKNQKNKNTVDNLKVQNQLCKKNCSHFIDQLEEICSEICLEDIKLQSQMNTDCESGKNINNNQKKMLNQNKKLSVDTILNQNQSKKQSQISQKSIQIQTKQQDIYQDINNEKNFTKKQMDQVRQETKNYHQYKEKGYNINVIGENGNNKNISNQQDLEKRQEKRKFQSQNQFQNQYQQKSQIDKKYRQKQKPQTIYKKKYSNNLQEKVGINDNINIQRNKQKQQNFIQKKNQNENVKIVYHCKNVKIQTNQNKNKCSNNNGSQPPLIDSIKEVHEKCDDKKDQQIQNQQQQNDNLKRNEKNYQQQQIQDFQQKNQDSQLIKDDEQKLTQKKVLKQKIFEFDYFDQSYCVKFDKWEDFEQNIDEIQKENQIDEYAIILLKINYFEQVLLHINENQQSGLDEEYQEIDYLMDKALQRFQEFQQSYELDQEFQQQHQNEELKDDYCKNLDKQSYLKLIHGKLWVLGFGMLGNIMIHVQFVSLNLNNHVRDVKHLEMNVFLFKANALIIFIYIVQLNGQKMDKVKIVLYVEQNGLLKIEDQNNQIQINIRKFTILSNDDYQFIKNEYIFKKQYQKPNMLNKINSVQQKQRNQFYLIIFQFQNLLLNNCQIKYKIETYYKKQLSQIYYLYCQFIHKFIYIIKNHLYSYIFLF